MKIPIPQVRELCAHVLQLCDYVTGSRNHQEDLAIMNTKARQIRLMIGAMYGDEIVRGNVAGHVGEFVVSGESRSLPQKSVARSSRQPVPSPAPSPPALVAAEDFATQPVVDIMQDYLDVEDLL